MSDYFEIGYFQLENLILNQVQFCFCDIRMQKAEVKDEPLKSMLQSAVPVEVNEVENFLIEKGGDKSIPVVLMCETGEKSQALANELNSKGYLNVNVIEGGFCGLLEESASMTHS